jgi:drug/metabolite transporter (DMT)-like permease
MGAAAVSGFANVYAKRHSQYPPLAVLAPSMLIAGIVIGSIGIAFEHPTIERALAPGSILSLLYLAILGSAVTFFINLWLLKHIPVWVVNFSSLVIPVIAVFVGIVFGHEIFAPQDLLGAAMVVAGMWFAVRTGDRPARSEGS